MFRLSSPAASERSTRRGIRTRLLAAAAAMLGLAAAAPADADTVFGLTSGNGLLSFNSATPGAVSSPVAITGLQTNESILGIDFRPATGQLYALGNSNRLYTVNTTTGAATQVGTAGAFSLSGNNYGFDFNPVPDRIRVTSDSGQNLRLNPNDGTLTATDTGLAFAPTDVNFGTFPRISGSAYSNNFAGTATTLLYDIDFSLGILATQNPPNNGTLNTVGSLGVSATGAVGFDIAPFNNSGSNVAFASLTPTATPGSSSFYLINLTTGAASLVGQIGTGVLLTDIAVAPNAAGAGAVPLPTATLAAIPAAALMVLYVRRTRSRKVASVQTA